MKPEVGDFSFAVSFGVCSYFVVVYLKHKSPFLLVPFVRSLVSSQGSYCESWNRIDGWGGETCKILCSFRGFICVLFPDLLAWKGKKIAWRLETRLWQIYHHCNIDFVCLLLLILLIPQIYKQDQLFLITRSISWFILHSVVSFWHGHQ